MPDKYLSQSEWKSVSKGTAWKADPLTKALAGFEKAEKGEPADALAALADVEKQADALAKAHKGDKALAAFLGELDKSLGKRRTELQKAQAEASKKGAAAEGEDEEADDVLLDPKRLLAQFNLLKRDPARRINFAVVEAGDKRDATIVLSPKIAPRKLFTKLQDICNVKVGSFGLAWLDGTTLMLQVDNKPMAGLGKKLRGPIREVGFKVGKVVLADPSGEVLEEAVEEGEGAAEAAAAAPADPQRTLFETRLAELMTALQTALDGGHPAAAKLREVLAFAREKAQAAQFAAGLQALNALQKLLGAPAAGAAPAAAPAAAALPPATYANSGRAWNITRTRVAGDVAKLRDAILNEYKGSPLLTEVSAKVRKLDKVVEGFDENLGGLLEQAAAAADDAERRKLHGQAAAAIRDMLGRLDKDPILSRLADNPFLPIDPRTALASTLQVLSRQIA